MTYSVVMRDPATGALGVGVQSHWFNVGRIVPWVRAGVGAVATQSLAEPLYGPRGLDRMAAGEGAGAALRALLSSDPTPEIRQIAFLDASGGVAAHTGTGCIAEAGHITGEGWSVQANIMRTSDVIPAMARAAESASGDLTQRILSVLTAAERAGGDLRGSQSASILIATDGPVPAVSLNVDDHPDPIAELARLVAVAALYEEMELGDAALGAGDMVAAAAAYDRAGRSPHANPEVIFWQAAGLAALGQTEAAGRSLRTAAAANPDLADLLERLPAAGLMERDVAEGLLAALR